MELETQQLPEWYQAYLRAMEARRKRLEESIRLSMERDRMYYRNFFGHPARFLESEQLCRDSRGGITSGRLYELYTRWCEQKNFPPAPSRMFHLWMKGQGEEHGLTYTGYMPGPEGKRARGYRGIREADGTDTISGKKIQSGI